MFIRQVIKIYLTPILLVILSSILLGSIPAITAFNIEKLISDQYNKQYIITYALIVGQTFLHRIQEFQLQQIQAKLQPIMISECNSITSKENHTHVNTIANFVSNFWPPCFIVRSIALIFSINIIIRNTNGVNLMPWNICTVAAFIIAIFWQPRTKQISQTKQELQNTLLSTYKKKPIKLTRACIQVNSIINQTILRHEIIKSILLNSIIVYLLYISWQMFQIHKTTISQTVMLSSLTINMIEVIWWLQHELALWQVQIQRFKQALKILNSK